MTVDTAAPAAIESIRVAVPPRNRLLGTALFAAYLLWLGWIAVQTVINGDFDLALFALFLLVPLPLLLVADWLSSSWEIDAGGLKRYGLLRRARFTPWQAVDRIGPGQRPNEVLVESGRQRFGIVLQHGDDQVEVLRHFGSTGAPGA